VDSVEMKSQPAFNSIAKTSLLKSGCEVLVAGDCDVAPERSNKIIG